MLSRRNISPIEIRNLLEFSKNHLVVTREQHLSSIVRLALTMTMRPSQPCVSVSVPSPSRTLLVSMRSCHPSNSRVYWPKLKRPTQLTRSILLPSRPNSLSGVQVVMSSSQTGRPLTSRDRWRRSHRLRRRRHHHRQGA